MRRLVELDTRPFGPGAAVLDVMRETFLPAVEIDSRYALAGFEQRDRNEQSGRRLIPNLATRDLPAALQRVCDVRPGV